MNRSRPGLPPPPPWWAMARSRGVPWWGAVCSAAAPVLLAVGSTIGGHLQPRPYNAMTGAVSALAALGAADRWVMTLAFATARRRGLLVPWGLRPRVSAAA